MPALHEMFQARNIIGRKRKDFGGWGEMFSVHQIVNFTYLTAIQRKRPLTGDLILTKSRREAANTKQDLNYLDIWSSGGLGFALFENESKHLVCR